MTQRDDLLRTPPDRTPNDIDRLMAQTEDMLRTLGIGPTSEQAGEALAYLRDGVLALRRMAHALEQRNIIDEKMADFAAMLQRGGAPAEDAELAPDGMPRKQR